MSCNTNVFVVVFSQPEYAYMSRKKPSLICLMTKNTKYKRFCRGMQSARICIYMERGKKREREGEIYR